MSWSESDSNDLSKGNIAKPCVENVAMLPHKPIMQIRRLLICNLANGHTLPKERRKRKEKNFNQMDKGSLNKDNIFSGI